MFLLRCIPIPPGLLPQKVNPMNNNNVLNDATLDRFYGHTNAENINRFFDTQNGIMVCGNRLIKYNDNRKRGYAECDFRDCRDCRLAIRCDSEIHWAFRLDNDEMTEIKILVNRALFVAEGGE